ncbi:MarR family transcriptional regulator [Lutibacter profundi]|uniref:MarR family transcriptional regulator n=1 Tax=Lutibacter profundi TaxID=1622118 RepID=A0A0X8G8M5_9FLAO|nr:MarR family transcriptional regulator [Lutibacter profundi]AMC12079.1 MarR family transcriptional regulator [Lutibacter profundi]
MGDISKDINSIFSNERVKALINIKYTANWLDTIGNELLKPFKISVQQYNILRILRGAEEAITVSTIKKRMIQKSPNATRLMDKLCAKKLIERTRCENDRRIVYVKISDKGLKLLSKINIEEFNNQMNNITVEEAETLNKILDKIR